MSSEQAAWVKTGVRVRWKGTPFGIGGVIVNTDGGVGGVGVQYDGSRVVWVGDVASSWEAAPGTVGSPSVMLDGDLCAKPEAVDGLDLTAQFGGAWSRARGDVSGDHVGRVRSEACYVCKAGPMQACGRTAAPAAANPSSFVQSPVAARVTELILGEHELLPVSTMEQVIARLDAIDAALKPLAHLTPRGISDERPVDMSRDVTPHLARTRAATSAGFADPLEIACPACGIARWGQCRAVVGLDPLPSTASLPAAEDQSQPAAQGHSESAQPTDRARLPTTPTPPNVPAHEERYKAAHEAMYVDLYAAPCPRCGAPRWGGCVAVDGEPTDVTPEEAVRVRVEHKDLGPVFLHISRTSDQLMLVARGLFEVCAVLVPRPRDALRPGLLPVARTWASLHEDERDFWRGSVVNYLDGTDEERMMSPVEWAALGAMVRVFGLERAGRS